MGKSGILLIVLGVALVGVAAYAYTTRSPGHTVGAGNQQQPSKSYQGQVSGPDNTGQQVGDIAKGIGAGIGAIISAVGSGQG